MLAAIAYSCLQSTRRLIRAEMHQKPKNLGMTLPGLQCAPFIPFLQHSNGFDSFPSSLNLRYKSFQLEDKIPLQLPRACDFVILDFLTPSHAFACSLAFIGQYTARQLTIISLSGRSKSVYCRWIVLGNLDNYVMERMQASTRTKRSAVRQTCLLKQSQRP
jgi:hypothetical protein